MERRQSLDLRAVGIVFAQLVIVFGVWAIWPTNHIFSRSPVYSVFAHYGSELFWGWFAVVAGSCQAYSLYRSHPTLTLISSGFLVAYFAACALFAEQSESHLPTWASYVVLLGWQIAVFVDSARQSPNTVILTRDLVRRWRHGN